MKSGDRAFFYHGPSGKQIYGVMQVTKPAYSDPTTNDPNWLAIDFEPMKTFDAPVTLEHIRSLPELQNMVLLKQPRVMVSPLTKKEFENISKIAIVEGKGKSKAVKKG